jgi:predicted phage terminase large subunit-like protein
MLPARPSDLDQIAVLTKDRDFQLGMTKLSAMRCERSLYQFVVQAWEIVEPGHPFQDNWHIRKLCRLLEQVYYRDDILFKRKRDARALINIPPGMMKSLIVMVFFPAWVWAKDPSKRFLCASYGSTLSNRDNLRCRQIIESPWYQSRWPVQLQDDQNTKTRYNTTAHGWRIATSVNGPGTGEHPDYILVDDPHTAAQARSDVERQQALDWFDNTLSTRLGRMPAFVLIMQRLHEDDLAGHLLRRGGWYHLRYPMRFEKCKCATAPVCDPDEAKRCPLHLADASWTPDPTDERTVEGELLFPALKDEDAVRQLELDLGPYGSAGQLQQRPAPEGGGQFKREWFKFIDAKPAIARRVRGWDTAGTEDGGDYTAGVKISEEFDWRVTPAAGLTPMKRELVSTGRFIVEDVVRDQLSPAGVDALMLATARIDGVECPQREEREGGSAGKGQIAAHAKLLVGYDHKEVILGADKITRAKPFRSQVEAGNVYLLRGVWNEEYIKELCGFPTAKHDDQVDGSSCAFNSLLMEPPPRKVRAVF